MDPLRWITFAALCLIFIEGFLLSMFPDQVRQLISNSDPQSLRMAGWAETAVAVGLAVALMVQ